MVAGHPPGHSRAAAGPLNGDDPTTEELRTRQSEREREERRRADEAEGEPDTDTHERRAEKAHYLKEKLAERERSEADDR